MSGVPQVQTIHPNGRVEWTPETQAALAQSRAYEASVKPHAENVWRQYQRGLLTFWELIESLTTIDAYLPVYTQMVEDLEKAGWTTNPENIRLVKDQHARLMRTRTGLGEQY